MPIIFISSVPFSGGERLAQILAQKLGYCYLSREEVVAQANECGIPVGKLEVAVIKKPSVQERMSHLKERYLAVATAAICEKAAGGSLVYYGRAGHRLLRGVAHVMRVYLVPNQDQRLMTAMQRLKLGREKATEFLRDVDRDVKAWVRFVHAVEMGDADRYDFILNLENLSLENAATALCGIAELPDFRPTPASQKAMEERLLEARARIKLALDERTADADLTVRSNAEILTITYMPRQASVAEAVPEVLRDIPGCREIRSTMASTNILWIQEKFRADSETFRHVYELARRLGAAVELLRYSPAAAIEGDEVLPTGASVTSFRPAYDGGVEDDVPIPPGEPDRGFLETLAALVHNGCSGGSQTVTGKREKVLSAINPSIPYCLIAVGDLFVEKTAAAQTRKTRDFMNFLALHVRAPVVSTADLGQRLRLRLSEALGVAASLLMLGVVYSLIFGHQGLVLDIIGGQYHRDHRWVAPVAIALIAPLVAALYGRTASFLLKLIKLE